MNSTVGTNRDFSGFAAVTNKDLKRFSLNIPPSSAPHIKYKTKSNSKSL